MVLALDPFVSADTLGFRISPSAITLPSPQFRTGARKMKLRSLSCIYGREPITKLIEGLLPPGKIYDQSLQSQGYRHGEFDGLPRFENCEFHSAYPFGMVHLEDSAVPLKVSITGWDPFIPLDDVVSGIPCAIIEYEFKNTSD
jgi:hypothetical protein